MLASRVSREEDGSRTVEFYDVDSDFGVAAMTFDLAKCSEEAITVDCANVLDTLTQQWTDLLASL